MFRLLGIGAGVLAAGWFAAPASAQAFISAEKLAHACASHAAADGNACDGYIAGVLDEAGSEASLKGSFCPPANAKLSLLREALGKYGAQHNDAGQTGVGLVRDMMKANYPCAR